jgi:plasmid rolling circle replication initiator protein Rep
LAQASTKLTYLTDLSPRDKTLERGKVQTEGFKTLYIGTKYHKYGERMQDCGSRLVFKFRLRDNYKTRYKLQSARFCRVPRCPQCQGRRALKWNAKTRQIMPKVLADTPKARFIMLTLTVPNCELKDLRSQLTEMTKAWNKLIKRKELKLWGWIRTTEINRSAIDQAHPHYHVLLMVPPTYFTNNYISQKRWTELWSQSFKSSEPLQVNVQAVKPKKGVLNQSEAEQVISATVEVIKYAAKPSNWLLNDDEIQKPGKRVRMPNQDWLLEVTRQLHNTRLIATGGALKEYFKELEDERQDAKEDLVHILKDVMTEPDADEPDQIFDWKPEVKRYALTAIA